MKKPDITPAQIVAIATSIIGVITAFGLNLTKEQTDSLLSLVQTIAPVMIGADAIIRYGRSRNS